MANFSIAAERPSLRLETLVTIRWLAIVGQTIAVSVVAFLLKYSFPLSACLGLIAMSAWLNVILRVRYRATHRLTDNAALAMLAYDILQLALLLYLTGGLQNPFAVLLGVPVIVSAAAQSPREIVPLGGLACIAVTLLVFYHQPLPWSIPGGLELPLEMRVGAWVAITATLVFTSVYAYRVANEARKLSDALAATELVLQREQHLHALDGLAAAAAHELGTPLATITLVSKEMMRALPGESPLREDAELLRSQAERCREILKKLTSLSGEGDRHIGRLPLSSLMEEVAAPHRNFGVTLLISPGATAGEPLLARNPGILYGLGNLLENAVDFAKDGVEFTAIWDASAISVTIRDDGPGFPANLLERVGEPFLTTRQGDRDGGGGLGLGVFIAKTLLERSGATVEFSNVGGADATGAQAAVRWRRADIDLSWQTAGETA
jgi:two-component system sensor histidine kinase RegB